MEAAREEGRRQGREEVLREIYGRDYPDQSENRPNGSPDSENGNQLKSNGVSKFVEWDSLCKDYQALGTKARRPSTALSVSNSTARPASSSGS